MGERGFMELDFDKYKAQQFCDNLDCDAYGKIGGNTIRTHRRLHHQVYCNACNQIWVMTKGTFFYNLKAPVSLILEVLKLGTARGKYGKMQILVQAFVYQGIRRDFQS